MGDEIQPQVATAPKATPAAAAAAAPAARTPAKKKSWWREDAAAPEEEAPHGTEPKSVERAKTFVEKSMSPTTFKADPEARLTWKTPTGEEKTVVAKKKPLGLIFTANQLPIKINEERPNGHGAEIGIKVGWVLTKINDTDITSKDTSFYEVDTMLHTVVGMLPDA